MSNPVNPPVRIFISYKHADGVVDDLRNHLGWPKNDDQATLFDDCQIEAGTRWNEVIAGELACAEIVILVVSAAFTRSPY